MASHPLAEATLAATAGDALARLARLEEEVASQGRAQAQEVVADVAEHVPQQQHVHH